MIIIIIYQSESPDATVYKCTTCYELAPLYLFILSYEHDR